MLQQPSAVTQTSIVSDPAGQILGSALRALSLEIQRESTGIHLLSSDKTLVESLLCALDQAWGVQQALRRYMLAEPSAETAAELLEQLAGETDALRRRLWPAQGYACEALTRVIDILELARNSLPRQP
ncbi:MAG TPA: hypothetical protein VF591_26300 [Pyrinomonadaceae bacterium]|jgi:hypothetical protein